MPRPIFESWGASEILKARLHRGRSADLYHLRETGGLKLDLVVETGRRVIGVKVKSGATVASDSFAGLHALPQRLEATASAEEIELRLVFGGDQRQDRTGAEAVPWREVQEASWC